MNAVTSARIALQFNLLCVATWLIFLISFHSPRALTAEPFNVMEFNYCDLSSPYSEASNPTRLPVGMRLHLCNPVSSKLIPGHEV